MIRLFTILSFILHGTIVLAQTPRLIIDEDQTPAGASITDITATPSLFFFTANDGEFPSALWRSNGTAAGTERVQNRPLESASSLQAVGNTLFFSGRDAAHGYELWKTNGTDAGTVLVKDINPGDDNSLIISSTGELNNVLFFEANDGVHGRELWKTDGTTAGTVLVKDINPGADRSNIRDFKESNGLLFFVADDGVHGRELWKTDGTASGTTMVKDIENGDDSGLSTLTGVSINNILYFVADNGVHGRELWKTDGTEVGTLMVKDINPGNGSSSPRGLIQFQQALYFFAQDSLWTTDGTFAGTVAVAPVETPSGMEAIVMQNKLFFNGTNDIHGEELWVSDGTEAGTARLKDINPGDADADPGNFTRVANTLYFVADNGVNGEELWKTDGTQVGTLPVKDIRPGEEGSISNTSSMVSFSNKLFFRANDGVAGSELWTSDGTEEGTVMLKEINTGTNGGNFFDNFQVLQNQLVFAKILDDKLWKTDGTELGTSLVKELQNISGLTRLNENLLLFSAETPETGEELWKTDGTETGTLPVKDIYPGNLDGFSSLAITPLPVLNGAMFFQAKNEETGEELWKSDGTLEGTVLVKDVRPGPLDSEPLKNAWVWAIYNDKLFFSADDGSVGTELWASDGTEAGTQLVKDLNPVSSSNPAFFAEANNLLFFSAKVNGLGRELWKTDGTTDGTVLVKDINPGEEDGEPVWMTNFNGTLFFRADGGAAGRELWKSDGTEAGTSLVRDIRFGLRSGNPEDFTIASGKLFFSAYNGETGRNIWTTDGTEAGTTALSTEIYGVQELTNVNGMLFFIGNDGKTGRELWKTDGTEAGTVRLSDIVPGPAHSVNEILQYHDGKLYFTATDPQHGSELWVLNALTLEVNLAASSTEICSPKDTVTFTTSVTNSGINPQYQWFINDEMVANRRRGGTSFMADSLSDGDVVKVQVVASPEVWVLSDSVFSETITIQLASFTAEITVEGNSLTASEGTSYQWFFGDTPLPDNTQSITVQESGNYQVEITNASGCVARSETVEVIVCTSDVPTIQVEGTTLTASEEGTYRWFLNGEELSDTTQSITAEQEGNYQVEVTDASGCVARSEEVEVEATVTSLADEQLARGLRMYPNPATSYLTIDSQMNEAVLVFIYTATGQLRHQSTLAPASEGTEVSLADLTPGLYLVQFASQRGVYQRKLIKH